MITVHVALVLLLPLAILGALDLDRWLRERRADDASYARLPVRESGPPSQETPTPRETPPREVPPRSVPQPASDAPARDEPSAERADRALGLADRPVERPVDRAFDQPAERELPPPRVEGRPGLYDPLGLEADEVAARRAAPLAIQTVPVGPDIVYVDELRRRQLTVPVDGIDVDDLYDSYRDPRSGGRVHQAMDIMAPKGTPVLAVDHGTIARKYQSRLGGVTLYQFGRQKVFSYYYAHLDRYAAGIEEGDEVEKGQVIGYVGSSGNASADAPHLHFGVYVLGDEKRWWKGDPINPFEIWRGED